MAISAGTFLAAGGGVKRATPPSARRRRNARALLLIDVVNPLAFAGARALQRAALPAARRLARLKAAAQRAGVPVIYVNDNFGLWGLGFRELVERVAARPSLGQPIVALLPPRPSDYFVLKPKHSGFYETSLELLLQRLGARSLILTGFAANICVWFTANDAHMRGYRLIVPRDCVASERAVDTRYTLQQLRRVMEADTRPWRHSCSLRPRG
jgi:nicotinamidase-related amidase